MSYSSIVPETAVVRGHARLMIFTTCGLSQFTCVRRLPHAKPYAHAYAI